jgi:hypothetical protein
VEFPELDDPRTGRKLIERTIIVANTSNMPVAAREASVYLAMTMGEYYRAMGLKVLILADSTSRWAQALRETSGRLEEIPGEEAFPAYLESVIAGFYERGGVVRLKDGSSLGLFHRGSGIGEEGTLQVLQSITRDGGFTWSPPTVVCDGTKLDGKHPCEPYVFRSPDGDELCCLMRENKRSGTSLVMFSQDEGKTWSKPVDTPWALTGDRHHGIYLPDGRLVIVFRNASPNSKDKAGFIAWVGTYDDIKQGKPGQYRVSLLKTFKDGFYPGLHQLPDGTIVATTYANYRKEDIGCSIVSVRFKMSAIDAMAGGNSKTR